MKPKRLDKKLSIVKKTVADLNHTELHSAKGGATETVNPSGFDYCQLSDGCRTFCLSNCDSYEYVCQPCTIIPTAGPHNILKS
jgi:hypothetical protein